MKARTKRRIVDWLISTVAVGAIITSEPAWWAWPAVVALVVWNFYDGMTRRDLSRAS